MCKVLCAVVGDDSCAQMRKFAKKGKFQEIFLKKVEKWANLRILAHKTLHTWRTNPSPTTAHKTVPHWPTGKVWAGALSNMYWAGVSGNFFDF
mgnify:CR=1